MKIRVGFGMGVAAGAASGPDVFWKVVDTCESIGFDSIWFSERVNSSLLDPMAAMAAVAGRTSRLKFGTSVLVVPGRNPVLLAKELATIDVLSGGRLVAGFGLGSTTPSEHSVFMVERKESASMTAEAVALILALWTEDSVSFTGKHYRVEGVTIGPKPVQKPYPDVWFGGRSKPAVRRVGQLGTGWLPSFITVDEYPTLANMVKRYATEAGREIDEEHYGALVAYVPEGQPSDAVASAIAARRPDADPGQIVVMGGYTELKARIEAFIDKGASKFVVIPAVPPRDWEVELKTLYDEVVTPLEN